jgi:hypothetical protein
MPAASQKTGKSLLKFFKPVKTSFPKPIEDILNEQKSAKILPFKKEEFKNLNSKEQNQSQDELPPPPPENAGWVETVGYLTKVCKHSIQTIGKAMASPIYKKIMNAKAASKIKVSGSILNTDIDQAESEMIKKQLMKEAEQEKLKAKRRRESADTDLNLDSTTENSSNEPATDSKDLQNNLDEKKSA